MTVKCVSLKKIHVSSTWGDPKQSDRVCGSPPPAVCERSVRKRPGTKVSRFSAVARKSAKVVEIKLILPWLLSSSSVTF